MPTLFGVQNTPTPATWTDCSGTINAGVGSAVISAAGTGYAVNDTVTLANGVVLTVATISSGVILTVNVTNHGSLAYASSLTFTNPAAQVSTSGSGTGATFTLSWNIGVATLVVAANATRQGYFLMNNSQAELLWFSDSLTSVSPYAPGSVPLNPAGPNYGGGNAEATVTNAVWAYGATAGHVYTAKWR
jgi:hypothetical protein